MTAIGRDTRPQVSFVLPSYNEETNIESALDRTIERGGEVLLRVRDHRHRRRVLGRHR